MAEATRWGTIPSASPWVGGEMTVTYQVLVREDAGRGYTARVLALPSLEVCAPTEAQAIAGAQAAIAEALRGARVVEVAVATHPWANLAGLYQGDEQFQDVLHEIDAQREALGSRELADRHGDRPTRGARGAS